MTHCSTCKLKCDDAEIARYFYGQKRFSKYQGIYVYYRTQCKFCFGKAMLQHYHATKPAISRYYQRLEARNVLQP